MIGKPTALSVFFVRKIEDQATARVYCFFVEHSINPGIDSYVECGQKAKKKNA